MATTLYLEAEDEITAAVSRIRGLKEPEAVLVISRASRIGTSRINFKLLAREAHQQGVNLVAVSDQPTVRALAVSAGLPAYDTVAAAQEALDTFRQQDEQLARRSGRLPGEPRPRPPSATAAGRPAAPAVPATAAAAADALRAGRAQQPGGGRAKAGVPPQSRAGEAGEATQVLPSPGLERRVVDSQPDEVDRQARRRARRRRMPLTPLLLLGLLVLLAGGGVYLAYLYLPTATITLQPHTLAVRPLEVRVTADPSVAVPDAAAGVIPAERIVLPIAVTGSFPATGLEVTRETASGTVRFSSENTVFDVPIRAGTIVSTTDGVEFETTESVTVPKATFGSGTRTRVDAPVRARNPGPRGNVPADSITQLPDDLAEAVIFVSNPRPTSGGVRIEQLAVTQEDYEAALDALIGELAGALQERLADPATTPRGLTLYPTSVRSDEPRAVPAASELVGTIAEQFDLSVDTSATVLAVNEALVGEVAAEQLRASLAAGQTLVGNHVDTSLGSGLVLGATILYRASASGQVFSEPDRAALLDVVRGMTVSEARAILEQHGTVEISVWPDVVDRLPEQAARINLTVLVPRESP